MSESAAGIRWVNGDHSARDSRNELQRITRHGETDVSTLESCEAGSGIDLPGYSWNRLSESCSTLKDMGFELIPERAQTVKAAQTLGCAKLAEAPCDRQVTKRLSS